MANNGLLLGIEEFRSLPSKKKLDCLYENQVIANKGQNDILREIKKYRLHQKIQYPWLVGLTMGIFFVIKSLVGRA